MTSARYLVNDKKNGMNILVTGICKKYGWMQKDEVLDADTWKAKNIFMGSQLIYTIFTITFVPFLYSNYFWSVVYIACIYMWCVWRGGTYYIEVFSERYKLQFIKDDPTENKADYSKSDSEEEVFEDAELFSDIVTALSEEAMTGNRFEDSDTDTSEDKKETESSMEKETGDISNSGELELAKSPDAQTADETNAREIKETADETNAREIKETADETKTR